MDDAEMGSVVLVFAAGPDLVSQESIIFLWTLLTGLGSASVALSIMVKNYAAAYSSYEQGRLAHAQREQLKQHTHAASEEVRALRRALREFLDGDPRFATMPRDKRAELARYLTEAYLAEKDQIRTARKFAEDRVLEIMLRINGRDLSETG